MLVTVFCAPRDRSEITFSLEVSPELELRDFVALCELESGIPAREIQITYAEQPLEDPSRALGTYGLKDGDVVVLRQAERLPPIQPAFPGLPRIDFSSIAVPSTSAVQRPGSQPPPQRQRHNPQQQQHQQQQHQQQQHQQQQHQQQQQQQQQPRSPPPPPPPSLTGSASSPQGLDNPALLRDMLLANPHELSLLKERNPPLAEALLSGDLERFTKVLLEQQQERARREQERIRLLTSDPFDLEAQAKIEEDIRQHNIEENMTIAMEEAPESFGQVVMLYINCKVNGHPVKAFVDSGAQMTIMSQACAERCNIMRLVDRRWAGIAKGVGTQKIIGRVHLAQVQIEGDFLPCSFSILEDQPMDMLLGLDMLKRHQCSIDLKKSVLLIGTTGTETRFLPEAELPECARLAYGADSHEDARPEEIADRELAEALHRSVQESDAEDGQTTSPQSPSSPLPVPSVQVPVSSSSPGHPRNPALDRSKSAPASLLQPPQVGSTLSGSSQSQPHFPGPPVPESPCLLDKQPVNQEALRQAPVPKSGSSFTPLQDHSPSFAPEGEYSPGLGGVECSLPSAMELNSGTGEEMLPSLFAHPEFSLSSLPMEQELDKVTDTSDAKKIHVVSGPSEREGVAVQMEGIGSEIPLNPSPTPATTSNSKPYSESGPCSSSTTEFPVATDAVPQRDQPEGERKSNSDTVPSLAAALLELHELLVSNRLALPQDRSPTPSHSCREDADGVDEGPVAESQAPSPRNTQLAPGEADTEARSAIPDGPFPDDRSPLTPSTSDSSGQEASVEGGLQMVHSPDTGRERKACETGTGLGSEPEEVSLAQPSLQVREPPEGQQGRGVADGRAAGPDPLDPPHFPVEVPSPMETSPQSPLPAAMNAPCLLVMPDEDPNSSVVTLPPHPPASLPAPLPPLQPASPLTPPSPAVPVPPPPPLYTLRSPVPPLSEQFPAAHIQRIQAAGFSAEEAADALEQAQGNLELALLMLLARKITVPPRS